jgi:hypothetical protein
MSNNQTEKTVTIVTPQNITVVHSNPSQSPTGNLALGGKQVGPSVLYKNPA